MKKLLATLAASAVAVSMFAFAGCGDNKDKGPEGTIPGNYEQKDPEQMGEILDNFFGDSGTGDSTGDKTDVVNPNLGIKIDLSGSAYAENYMDISGSVKADFKENVTDKGVFGKGEATVKASAKMVGVNEKDPTAMADMFSIDASGVAYNDSNYIYAGATGKLNGEDLVANDMKVKINLAELAAGLGGASDKKPAPSNPASPSAADLTEASGAFDMATLLAMADEFGVVVSADVSDGLKVKISATEETVWKVVEFVFAQNDMPAADVATAVAHYKSCVTVNKFTLDIYAAFNSSKTITGASVVIDVDVKVDLAKLFEQQGQTLVLDAKVAGSIELYTHNDTVTVPASVATDKDYYDVTDMLLDMIGDMM